MSNDEAEVIYTDNVSVIVSESEPEVNVIITTEDIPEEILPDVDASVVYVNDEAVIVTESDSVVEVISEEEEEVTVIESIETGPQGPPGVGELPIIADPNDGELHLTPKASSSGAEGTIFYCNDKHVYVGVEP